MMTEKELAKIEKRLRDPAEEELAKIEKRRQGLTEEELTKIETLCRSHAQNWVVVGPLIAEIRRLRAEGGESMALYVARLRANERELCAKLVESAGPFSYRNHTTLAAAIRALTP